MTPVWLALTITTIRLRRAVVTRNVTFQQAGDLRTRRAHGYGVTVAPWLSDFAAVRAGASLDHRIGAREQHRRHSDAERPGRLQVDDELEFG
jgi:hypothetical protein